MLRFFILTLFSLHACDAYKFLVYSPIFGFSHTNFMGAIADALTEAGHDVTVLMPVMNFEQEDKTGLKLTKKIIKVGTDPREYDMIANKKEMLSGMWRMGTSFLGFFQTAGNVTNSFVHLCKGVFHDEKLMKSLEEEKFDVGISAVFEICGLAGWSTKGDRMNFIDRIANLLAVVIGKTFFTRTYDEQIKAFREKFGSQFKGYNELIAGVSFVVTNSNPYLDYPRPILPRTVPIGGITVTEWDDILNERNTTVLVSFGSVLKSIYMPDEYKKTLLEVFESMPETTFIWKYEEEGSKIAEHLKNVHLNPWVPQNVLLADRRLTVFVTHGGLGSVTELAHMGKPAILIPIFADQTRNAHMFYKHGGGIVLTKVDLEHPKKLRESLYKIFTDASFSENSRLLAEILHNQPVKPKQLLVKHSEFAARFGYVQNLDAYGRHLSFIQYYLIDVVLACFCIVLVDLFIVVKLLRKCFSLRNKKSKSD